jgi:integrator complex subunit 4
MQGAHADTEGSRVRLIDDAFVKICDLVNDWTIEVRIHVCEIMGKFRGVETTVLRQTLSKNILQPKKRPKQNQNHAPKKRKRDVDTAFSLGDQDLDEKEMGLVEASSCGAFIHAMEDEFQEVRDAAICK